MNAVKIEFQEYINQKKELYDNLLDFLLNEKECNIPDLFKNCLIAQDKKEIKYEIKFLLSFILKISNYHHRTTQFDQKINEILLFFSKAIKQTFSNLEAFNFFKNNKRILLFLLTNDIIVFDDLILQNIRIDKSLCHFFYPEIESHLTTNEKEEINNELLSINPDIFINFEEKRQNGVNDTYICSLIRQDSIIEFISYVNKTEYLLSSPIKESIFETNSYLIENNPTLIEYAVFYGSIQIFNYLKMNNIELTESLWLYAIHSNDSEIIYQLEENKVSIENAECLFEEAIKCHHNSVAEYIKNTYCDKINNLISLCFHYYNFFYMSPEVTDEEFVNNASRYDYYTFVKFCIKMRNFDKNDDQFAFSKNYNFFVFLIS